MKERAQSGQLLVSTACHDLLTRLDPDTAELFQYHSPTGDLPLEVYCVIPSSGDAARETAASFIVTRPLPLFQTSALDQQTVQDVASSSARRQSIRAPEAFTTCDHFWISSCRMRPNCSGCVT